MRAIVLAALVCVTIGNARAFYGYDAYRDARSNYYEILTNCEREGGECISVDLGGPDPTPEPTQPPTPEPTSPPETDAPPTKIVPVYVPVYQTTRAPRVATRAPAPVYRAPPQRTAAPFRQYFNGIPIKVYTAAPSSRTAAPRLFNQVPLKVFNAAPPPRLSPLKPVTMKPRPTTKAPRPTTKAPRPTTKAPRPTTKAPRKTTKAPKTTKKALKKKDSKTPPKNPKARKAWLRRNPEYEGVERRKRAVLWGPDPLDYLYNECTGGWEFDLGCGAKGKNVCCYPSNNGY